MYIYITTMEKKIKGGFSGFFWIAQSAEKEYGDAAIFLLISMPFRGKIIIEICFIFNKRMRFLFLLWIWA